MSNKKKDLQLGMSHSTASNQLRKIVLFNLLVKHKENNCYRCTKPIEEIEQLSIEHKTPWLDSKNPVKLFFDLENIAFSHLNCNISEARKPFKILDKPGYLWCWRCQTYKKCDEFPPSAMISRQKDCSACYSNYRAGYRERTGKR